ncbi:MAG: CBS domain-containing protein [Gammaproteobacteria bacterium]
MYVSDMVREKGERVVTVAPQESVANVVKRLIDEQIGAVVVCDSEGRVCGVLAERDIVHGLGTQGAAVLQRSASDLMHAAVTCRPSDKVVKLMALMTNRRVRHLPVIDDDQKLSGIVSIGDAVKCRLAEIENESRALREYISMA